MSKYYAVKKGRNIGIFNTWDECLESTKGFPGAIFKSFNSEEEAKAFLEDKDIYNFFIPHLRNYHFIFIYLHANMKKKRSNGK